MAAVKAVASHRTPKMEPVAFLEDARGTHYPLRSGVNTLGSDRANSVCLRSHPGVALYHAELRWEGGRFTLIDLGSASGTRLRGVHLPRFRPHLLAPGETFHLGSTALTLSACSPDTVPASRPTASPARSRVQFRLQCEGLPTEMTLTTDPYANSVDAIIRRLQQNPHIKLPERDAEGRLLTYRLRHGDRELPGDQTLAQAGVRPGALLHLVPRVVTQTAPPAPAQPLPKAFGTPPPETKKEVRLPEHRPPSQRVGTPPLAPPAAPTRSPASPPVRPAKGLAPAEQRYREAVVEIEVLLAAGNVREARPRLERLASDNPNRSYPRVTAAYLAVEADDWATALRLLPDAAPVYPDPRWPEEPDVRAAHYWTAGRLALRHDHTGPALAALERCRLLPHPPRGAAYWRAVALLHAGQFATAEAALCEVAKDEPARAAPWIQLGLGRLAAGQPIRAAEALAEASRRRSPADDAAVGYLEGLLLAREGQSEAAAHAWERGAGGAGRYAALCAARLVAGPSLPISEVARAWCERALIPIASGRRDDLRVRLALLRYRLSGGREGAARLVALREELAGREAPEAAFLRGCLAHALGDPDAMGTLREWAPLLGEKRRSTLSPEAMRWLDEAAGDLHYQRADYEAAADAWRPLLVAGAPRAAAKLTLACFRLGALDEAAFAADAWLREARNAARETRNPDDLTSNLDIRGALSATCDSHSALLYRIAIDLRRYGRATPTTDAAAEELVASAPANRLYQVVEAVNWHLSGDIDRQAAGREALARLAVADGDPLTRAMVAVFGRAVGADVPEESVTSLPGVAGEAAPLLQRAARRWAARGNLDAALRTLGEGIGSPEAKMAAGWLALRAVERARVGDCQGCRETARRALILVGEERPWGADLHRALEALAEEEARSPEAVPVAPLDIGWERLRLDAVGMAADPEDARAWHALAVLRHTRAFERERRGEPSAIADWEAAAAAWERLVPISSGFWPDLAARADVAQDAVHEVRRRLPQWCLAPHVELARRFAAVDPDRARRHLALIRDSPWEESVRAAARQAAHAEALAEAERLYREGEAVAALDRLRHQLALDPDYAPALAMALRQAVADARAIIALPGSERLQAAEARLRQVAPLVEASRFIGTAANPDPDCIGTLAEYEACWARYEADRDDSYSRKSAAGELPTWSECDAACLRLEAAAAHADRAVRYCPADPELRRLAAELHRQGAAVAALAAELLDRAAMKNPSERLRLHAAAEEHRERAQLARAAAEACERSRPEPPAGHPVAQASQPAPTADTGQARMPALLPWDPAGSPWVWRDTNPYTDPGEVQDRIIRALLTLPEGASGVGSAASVTDPIAAILAQREALAGDDPGLAPPAEIAAALSVLLPPAAPELFQLPLPPLSPFPFPPSEEIEFDR